MHYVDEGPRDAPPVLMVHGNPTWSFYYRNLIAGLSDRFRTIAIDHIGCGLSDKPQDYDYCLQNHIDNVCNLVERLDLQNTTLVAHDWGGAIGLGALQKLRERFSKIVLFNTAAFPPPFIPFRIRVCRWPVFGKVGLQGMNLFAKAAVTMATERPDGLPQDVADGLLAPYDSWSNRIATYKFVKDIPLSRSHKTWEVLERIEAGLPELGCMPIRLIWGMKDWCFRPECLDRFESHWPDAVVTKFENGGHYIVEDEPEKIVSLVREFLDAAK
ncbi:Haloalkane dehalogenase [Mariniblastus fucicola]|uniref:Haloalkane dehalogenase n=2 Tax=Mariniblastus fucicola TaxID=980251 RepID=A0A5B9P9R4_9BACT|nr:Haloalkane dehalogenase [Mariniblastus fucicola]